MSDSSCREPFGALRHQEAEYREPMLLRQRSQGHYSRICFHICGYIEMSRLGQWRSAIGVARTLAPEPIVYGRASASSSMRMRWASNTAFATEKIKAIFQAPKTSGSTAISAATMR